MPAGFATKQLIRDGAIRTTPIPSEVAVEYFLFWPFTSPFRNYFTATYLRVLRFGVQAMVGVLPSRVSLMVAAIPASRLFSLTVSVW